MRHAALRSCCLLLGLASCFSDSGGETGATTGEAGSAAGTDSAGTTSGATTSATAGESTSDRPLTTTGVDPTTTDPTTTADPTGDDDDDDAETCEDYCNVYMFNCGALSEYDDLAGCLQQCSQWPPGVEDDESGDSRSCREYHASVAVLDAAVHCPHAGPSGAGVCADAGAPGCADYCERYFLSCAAFPVYADQAACVEQCSRWYPGTKDDTTSDTVGCRTYHATAAAEDAPTHCPHARPDGGGVCVVMP